MSPAEEEMPSPEDQPFLLPAGAEPGQSTIGVNADCQIISVVDGEDRAHVHDWPSVQMFDLAATIKRAARQKRRREKASGR